MKSAGYVNQVNSGTITELAGSYTRNLSSYPSIIGVRVLNSNSKDIADFLVVRDGYTNSTESMSATKIDSTVYTVLVTLASQKITIEIKAGSLSGQAGTVYFYTFV